MYRGCTSIYPLAWCPLRPQRCQGWTQRPFLFFVQQQPLSPRNRVGFLVNHAKQITKIHGFSIHQWPFQDPRLEVPIPYIRSIFRAYFSGNIPAKYGQTYGTKLVPPSIGSFFPIESMMVKSAESGIPQMMCVALVSATVGAENKHSLPLNPRVILVITTTIYFKWLREYPNITISHSTYMLLCYPIQLHHHQYQTINGIF